MRNTFFLILFLLFFLTEGLTAKEDDSRLIRRAYLDLIGCVPTIEEMEWYCVYNDNGYKLAINYLLTHPKNKWKDIPKEYLEMVLNSEEFKKSKRYLTEEEKRYILSYVVGDIYMTYDLDKVKKRIVSDAIKYGNSELDIIDYMFNVLICRSTNINEANMLLGYYRGYTNKTEEEKMLKILEKIINLEEFIMR